MKRIISFICITALICTLFIVVPVSAALTNSIYDYITPGNMALNVSANTSFSDDGSNTPANAQTFVFNTAWVSASNALDGNQEWFDIQLKSTTTALSAVGYMPRQGVETGRAAKVKIYAGTASPKTNLQDMTVVWDSTDSGSDAPWEYSSGTDAKIVTFPPMEATWIRIEFHSVVDEGNEVSASAIWAETATPSPDIYTGKIPFAKGVFYANESEKRPVSRLSSGTLTGVAQIEVDGETIDVPAGNRNNVSLDWAAEFVVGGNCEIRTSEYHYKAGQAYVQFDFGKTISLGMFSANMRYAHGRYASSTMTSEPGAQIPKRFRVEWSDDGETWEVGPNVTHDLTDPTSVGQEMADAYSRVIANIKEDKSINTSVSTSDPDIVFLRDFKYKFDPVEAQYFRFVILEPTQDGTYPYNYGINAVSWYDTSSRTITADWTSQQRSDRSYSKGIHGDAEPRELFLADGTRPAVSTNSNALYLSFDPSSTSGGREFTGTRPNSGLGAGEPLAHLGVNFSGGWIVIDLGREYFLDRYLLNKSGTADAAYYVQVGRGTDQEKYVGVGGERVTDMDTLPLLAEDGTTIIRGHAVIDQDWETVVGGEPITDPLAFATGSRESGGVLNVTARYLRFHFTTFAWGEALTHIGLYTRQPKMGVEEVSVVNSDADTNMVETGELLSGEAEVSIRVRNEIEENGINIAAFAALYKRDGEICTLDKVWLKDDIMPLHRFPQSLVIPIYIPDDVDLSEYKLEILLMDGNDAITPLSGYEVVKIQ